MNKRPLLACSAHAGNILTAATYPLRVYVPPMAQLTAFRPRAWRKCFNRNSKGWKLTSLHNSKRAMVLGFVVSAKTLPAVPAWLTPTK